MGNGNARHSSMHTLTFCNGSYKCRNIWTRDATFVSLSVTDQAMVPRCRILLSCLPTQIPLTTFSLLSVSAKHSCACRCIAVRAPIRLITWRGVALMRLGVGLRVGWLVAVATASKQPVALSLRVHHAPDGAQVWFLDNHAPSSTYPGSCQWLACKFVPLQQWRWWWEKLRKSEV